MQKIVVKGLGSLIDGEYDLVQVDEFTADEWYAIRKAWGLVVGDFIEAQDTAKLDMNILSAMALVACMRADRPNARQLLGKASFANLEIVADPDDAEADADPPELPNSDESAPESEPKTDDGDPSSGESSKPSSVKLVEGLPPTGTLG